MFTNDHARIRKVALRHRGEESASLILFCLHADASVLAPRSEGESDPPGLV